MQSPAVSRVLRFGAFEADLQARELRKQGMQIKLQEQPFQILEFLLEHPGEIVTREQLRQKLWPADTFVDVDNSVNAAINRLREALGDSAESPRFVETLPRRGYRFVAPVTEVKGPEGLAISRTTKPATDAWPDAVQAGGNSKARRSWGKLSIALGLAVTLVVASVWGWGKWRAPSPPRITSLAVLPLENLSGDPAQEYFADGMTDELITELGKISAVRVISRTSVIRYKGTKKTLLVIARELNVDAVVEGAVLRSGGRVRITAQLIQAANERHLWAESYERDLRDILGLQDEVARAIAAEIRVKLTAAENARLTRAQPVDPETYDLYLKGRDSFNKRMQGALGPAIEYFGMATERDPSFALAYSGLADSYTVQASWGWESPKESLEKAKAAAEKALALNDSLAEPYASLAFVKLHTWDFAGAEVAFKRALEINPSYANAHHWYSHYLLAVGRVEESLVESKRALIFDPLDYSIQVHLGWHYYLAHQYDLALPPLKRTLAEDAKSPLAHSILGQVYEQQGSYPQAIGEFRNAVADSGGVAIYIAQLAHAEAAAGKRTEALRALAELKRLATQRFVPPDEIAKIYIALGDKESAFAWLEKAYQERSASLVDIKIDPEFDQLRNDQRFQQLVRRMGFL